MKKSLIVIVGPTAVGKTSVSIELAKKLSCSVVNADSRQLFIEMNIGTAKPSEEEMAGVKHYFVNDRSIEEEFSAGKFEREALAVLKIEFKNSDVCIMSGGSGLYIDALCLGLNDFPAVGAEARATLNKELKEQGIAKLYKELQKVDPIYAEEVQSNNTQRIIRALEIYRSSNISYSSLRTGLNSERDFNIHYIGLELPREELYLKINRRMDQMIEAGLFEEAERLIKFRDKNALQTVGYTEVYQHLDGLIDKQEAIRLLKRNSRRYAKRQLTWFKRNQATKWFSPLETIEISKYVNELLEA